MASLKAPWFVRLTPYMSRQWPKLLLIILLTIGTSLMAAMQPWPLKILVDNGLGGDTAPDIVIRLFSLIGLNNPDAVSLILFAALLGLAIFVLNSILDTALNWSWTLAGLRMVYDLAGALFARLQRLSLKYHSSTSLGDSVIRLSTDSWCVYELTASALVTPLQHIFTLSTIGVVAWSLDPSLTLVSLAMAPLLGGSSVYFGSRMKKKAHGTRQAQARLMSHTQQVLSSIPLVQVFGAERRNRNQFRTLADDAVRWIQGSSLERSSFGLANGLITTAGMGIILFVGGQRVLSGALTLGGLLVFLQYIRTLQRAAGGLLRTYGSLKPVQASVERVFDVLDVDDPVADQPGTLSLPEPLYGERGHIQFKDVTFGYDPEKPVLEGVSLEANPGEVIALVGATGSGKSSLVSLIARFYDVWAGQVLFDGMDVREIKLKQLRDQVSFVLQEPFLLPMTVAQNISYGRPEADMNDVVAAAKAANAHQFISELPDSYETLVGERGANLSGGQRQRIAIARAFLKDASVLILDEPTSGQDAESEQMIVEALHRLTKKRTCFIIAHRLSTVRQADRILVLQDGRIIESGTHDELLATNSAYRQLHDLQFAVPGGGAR